MSFYENRSNWPLIPLGKIATLKRGYDLPLKQRKPGNIPIFAANGRNGCHAEIKVNSPGVVTGRSGTIGKVHFVDTGFWPLNTALYVQDFHGNDPKWVFYLLKNFKLERFSQGAGVPTLNRNLVHSELVPLPPLEEQKRIAAILDQADALRRKRKKAIALTNDFLRSVFLDMFGDPVANTKKWEVKTLEKMTTKICSGSTPAGGKKVYVDDGYLFLRSQNVWRRRLELDDVAFIDKKTHEKMNKTSLKNGDILITKTGRINTENSSLGRAAMFTGADDSANINGHVYLIRPKPEALNDFILYIMTMPEYREYIRSVCVGGIDKRQINKEHLEQFPIINPPIELQHKFIDCLNVVERQRKSLNDQLKHANDMFHSLTHQAFSGELTAQKEAA